MGVINRLATNIATAMVIGVAVVSTSAFSSAQAVPLSGLVGYFEGNNNANDSSTTGNNGTFAGNYVSGLNGPAFDLSTGNVIIPDNTAYSFGPNFSVGFWFDGRGGGTFVGQDTGGGSLSKWFIDYGFGNAGMFEIHLNGTSSVYLASNSVPFPQGWNQFTLTKNGSTYGFYLNGLNIGSQSFAGTFPDPTASLVFGIMEPNVSGFTGLMQDVVLYDRTLTDSEIQSLAASTPLPAALPLFASGLGVMGWLARRRKKKATTALAA